MCAVCFTMYDIIPAGAAWMRAKWGKNAVSAAPDTADDGAAVDRPDAGAGAGAAVLGESEPVLAGGTDPVGDQSVHAEGDRVGVPARLDDPRVDAEPLLVGR